MRPAARGVRQARSLRLARTGIQMKQDSHKRRQIHDLSDLAQFGHPGEQRVLNKTDKRDRDVREHQIKRSRCRSHAKKGIDDWPCVLQNAMKYSLRKVIVRQRRENLGKDF